MRDININLKVSAEELSAIDTAAKNSGKNRSKHLRDSALGRTSAVYVFDSEAVRKHYVELARVGNNLNQIAKRLNRGEQFDGADIRRLQSILLTTLEEVAFAKLDFANFLASATLEGEGENDYR